MATEKRGFVPIKELNEQLAADQVPKAFGVTDDEIIRRGKEIRMHCFMQCGKDCATANDVIAINSEHPANLWMCHKYNCKKNGDVAAMLSLAMGGPLRPKGEEFKKVLAAMQEIVRNGMCETLSSPDASQTPTTQSPLPAAKPVINIPLAESDNPNARGVADLHKKLKTDVGKLTPAASRYVRCRPFLTPEVMERWNCGYLSLDSNGDRTGGTMRGRFVVAIPNSEGKIVGYTGRDPDWENKHAKWVDGGREGKEPAKWLFPRSFHRGVELYAEHKFNEGNIGDKLQDIGLPVVEGALDCINTWETLDVPSVALLSNQATDFQLRRIAELAHTYANGVATLLYDCNPEGDNGANKDSGELAKYCRVQRAWWLGCHNRRFDGREPSDLTVEDWEAVKVSMAVQ